MMELNLITPQNVVPKIDEPFYFRGLTHLLCQTWQLSYVEFYCIGLEQQNDAVHALSYALENTDMSEFETISWLMNTEFLSRTKEQLQSHLKFAIHEVDNVLKESPNYYSAQLLSQLLQSQNIDKVGYIYEINALFGRTPNSPHTTAPPYQYFWQSGLNFYLLTIHQES